MKCILILIAVIFLSLTAETKKHSAGCKSEFTLNAKLECLVAKLEKYKELLKGDDGLTWARLQNLINLAPTYPGYNKDYDKASKKKLIKWLSAAIIAAKEKVDDAAKKKAEAKEKADAATKREDSTGLADGDFDGDGLGSHFDDAGTDTYGQDDDYYY